MADFERALYYGAGVFVGSWPPHLESMRDNLLVALVVAVGAFGIMRLYSLIPTGERK